MESRPILALNAYDPRESAALGGPLEAQLARRAAAFGAASVLFYDRPLEFLRGSGCTLIDAAGVEYLDAYNNVPSVGHCHPHVVQAVTRQLGLLNVHNRYLHPGTLDYAERLLATFPAPLSNLTLTCTGSESNDLALRLAATFTGRRGVIVTEAAYHGNTALVTEVSPTLVQQGAVAPIVRLVPAPRSMRQSARVAEEFAAHVTAAIADLERAGAGCSALLVDGIFSSDGIFAQPPGLLRGAVEAVHRAGGLYIADEVQCGFGRTGDALWGFQRHGVTPDVVTLGKPMGNGYPMGGVVARPELLEAFCARFGYFNTFGGSPVAAAAGNAVLDVLEGEGLMDNAARVGAQLRARLQELALRQPAVGDVRGAGLYVGVDLVDPTGAPAPALARAVMNGLRERRVLIGAAGKFGHVLKIRPPLCFSAAHAERLVAALDEVLSDLGAG